MKFFVTALTLTTLWMACQTDSPKKAPLAITGTWQLISATSTEKDSTYSTFNPATKMIKMLNESHFAFFNHDMQHGKDTSNVVFAGGGGTYTLKDSVYTEHLEYFNDRAWEDHTFSFVVKIHNDTLVQSGVEKLENLGIDRIITEKYIRVKK
jgi:hypothetical protein